MTINEMVEQAHGMAVEKGWWDEDRGVGEAIALMHSELSEALEEARKGHSPELIYYEKNSDKPEGVGVELADCVIRIADFCGRHKIDLEHIIEMKMKYNATRPTKHGKVF